MYRQHCESEGNRKKERKKSKEGRAQGGKEGVERGELCSASLSYIRTDIQQLKKFIS